MGRTHPNLVGHWRAENNPNDTSGNGQSGIWSGAPTYAKGVGGQCFDFDVSSYVSIFAAGSDWLIGDFAFNAWVKSVDGNIGGAVIGTVNVGTGTFFQVSLNEPHNGFIRIALRGPSAADVSISTNHPNGEWFHLAYTYKTGIGMTAYINGVFAGSAGTVPERTLTEYSTWIGAQNNRGGFSRGFEGQLDDVQIWNAALQPHHIRAIYNGVDPAFIGDVA
jgi:hypothetical protein